MSEEKYPGRAGRRVLVAEDNEKSRQFIGKILEDLDCPATFARTGEDAVSVLRAGGVDLLLLDILIPKPNGYQILEMLKGDTDLWSLPVIVITGIDSVDSAARCIELGADDYITKPFNPVLLQARIRASLEKRASREREVLLRKRIEEQNIALAEREKYYRGVVEDQTELICRYDKSFLLSFVNGAYVRFFGKDSAMGESGPAFSFLPEARLAAFYSKLSALTPINQTMEAETPVAAAGGSVKWLQWTNRAIFGEDGSLLEYQSVGRDITERRLVESALRESERNLRKAQNIANMGYLSWRPGFSQEIWSGQVYEIFGLKQGVDEPSHQLLLEMAFPEEREKLSAILNSERAPAGGFEIEFRAVRRDGNSRFLNLHGEAAPDSPGANPRVEAVISDITKSKQIERQLIIEKDKAEAATKMKDRFISLVSHDLRAPLGAVQGLLELVDEGGLSREKEKDFIFRAADNCKKLLRTLDNLLNLNNIRSGVLRPEARKVFARELIDSSWDKIRYLAAQKGVTLENRIDPGAAINADPQLADQVFSNLLHNAIKFSFPNGVIAAFIPAGAPDMVAIKDEGTGMAADVLAKLFQRDFRVSIPGTAGERGTGLGLTLSQDIIGAHGGLISVESEPGKGSVFKIKFPEATPTLLIVDDDEDFRLLMRTDLENLRLRIMEAENGASAMEISRGQTLSLVITDMEMPGMDGCELAEKIKSQSSGRPVPVIVMSVNSDYHSKIRAMKFGADDYLIKPVGREALLAAVRRFVAV